MKKLLFILLMFLSTSALALDLSLGAGTCKTDVQNMCDGHQYMVRLGQDILNLGGENSLRLEVERYGDKTNFTSSDDSAVNKTTLILHIKLR